MPPPPWAQRIDRRPLRRRRMRQQSMRDYPRSKRRQLLSFLRPRDRVHLSRIRIYLLGSALRSSSLLEFRCTKENDPFLIPLPPSQCFPCSAIFGHSKLTERVKVAATGYSHALRMRPFFTSIPVFPSPARRHRRRSSVCVGSWPVAEQREKTDPTLLHCRRLRRLQQREGCFCFCCSLCRSPDRRRAPQTHDLTMNETTIASKPLKPPSRDKSRCRTHGERP